MDVFKQIENDFRKRALGIAVDDPYQTICDYYYDYISNIDKVINEPQNKYILSNIVSSLQIIKQKLNEGLANCPMWDRNMGNRHFKQVHELIQNLKTNYHLNVPQK